MQHVEYYELGVAWKLKGKKRKVRRDSPGMRRMGAGQEAALVRGTPVSEEPKGPSS